MEIFTHFILIQETKSALDAEISGEYLDAIRIYSDLNAHGAAADADERSKGVLLMLLTGSNNIMSACHFQRNVGR
jgi:hypothetical protein